MVFPLDPLREFAPGLEVVQLWFLALFCHTWSNQTLILDPGLVYRIAVGYPSNYHLITLQIP